MREQQGPADSAREGKLGNECENKAGERAVSQEDWECSLAYPAQDWIQRQ